jgi:spore germination protein
MFKRFCVGALVAMVLALLVVGSVVQPVSAAPDECTVHIVRRGENLYRISLRYGVSMWAIARANGIANPNRIYAGQRLVIPAGQACCGYTGTVHVVQRGENLYRISLRYGVSMWAIVRANHIANPNHIYTGQRLVIP